MRRGSSLFSFLPLFTGIIAGQTASAPTPLMSLSPSSVALQRTQIQRWTFEAPAVAPGSVPAIAFDARVWNGPIHSAGQLYGYILDVRLNHQHVQGAADRFSDNLLNKPLPITGSLPWHAWHLGWRVLSAPSFDAAASGRYGLSAFYFVIDVKSLIKSGTNTLSIQYYAPGSLSGSILYIANLQVVSAPEKPAPAVAPLRVARAQQKSYQVSDDGAIRLTTESASFSITSAFSVPGGGWLRWGPPITPESSEKPASVNVISSEASKKVLKSSEAGYTVQRIAELKEGRARIRDQITNPTDQDFGVMVRYEWALPGKPASVHLSGNADPSINQVVSPANPTIFVPLGNLGLGLVAEDDILRQGTFSFDPASSKLQIKIEHLVIPAGKTVTLQWSAYALSTNDYYDFINRVRNDWSVHIRLNGPYWWNILGDLRDKHMTDDQLKAWMSRTRVYAAVIGTWYQPQNRKQIAFGAGVLDPSFDQYREELRQVVDRLHRLFPTLKVLLYTDVWYESPDPNPTTDFQDAWITLQSGKRFIETFGGAAEPAYGVYPTASNSYGQAYRQALERLRSTLHVDGFYFDESTGPGRLVNHNSYAPFTFSTWDGNSALLNAKTFSIEQKVGYFSLLSTSYFKDLWASLRGEGLTLLANVEPNSLSLNDGMPHFVETQELREGFHSHLYSPLAFNYDFQSYTVRDLRDRLDVGTIYCVTSPEAKIGIVDKFFPITPTEIHSGWVVGQERVITDVSGRYGWNDYSGRVRIWAFKEDGSPVDPIPNWHSVHGLVQVDVPDRGIAILEREQF